ncbi:hypothetical protein GCM10010911_14380 [Paenibacillus nasutitermitis]|uniref:Uncharacterized protein n=1 Tax=Paenibacillus nasutitermitis TaxID=1652958 RepID=A0A917DP79_9BACL|nr:hypothetical protein GCM10010911_14380 [Paenibacillus nasutitermitis]
MLMDLHFIWQAMLVLFVGFCLLRILGKKTADEMSGHFNESVHIFLAIPLPVQYVNTKGGMMNGTDSTKSTQEPVGGTRNFSGSYREFPAGHPEATTGIT